MTDPASPAAVTEERIEFIRTQYNSLVATLAESNQTPGHWATYTADLLAALDARGLELARRDEEVASLRWIKASYERDIEQRAKWASEQLDQISNLEARLAQANEALNAGPFTLHRQGDDCMSPGGCRFSIFDGEGNVWAMFDTLPIDDRRKAQSIVGALNATPTPPAQSAGEALDPAGTGEGEKKPWRPDYGMIRRYKAAREALCVGVTDGVAEEQLLAALAAGMIPPSEVAAQASALAEARRSALEEAANLADYIAAHYMVGDSVDAVRRVANENRTIREK